MYPLTPAVPALTEATMKAPLDVAVPLLAERETKPPVWSVLLPDENTTSPPVFPVAAPPVIAMSPLRPNTLAFPVLNRIAPDDPLDAAPELKARLPEAPFEPASTDFTTTLPLEVAVPDPVLNDM